MEISNVLCERKIIMRKNIDLSDEAVKVLSIQAIENGTNFKNYVEAKLEELAKTKFPLLSTNDAKTKQI